MKPIVLAGLLSLAALAPAQDVRFDYDRAANFGAFQTYQWVAPKTGAAANQLVEQNIQRAVDSQLALKGLHRVDEGGDLQVSYQVNVAQEKQFDAFGPGPRFTGPGRVTTSSVDVGTLAIDMVDPARGQLVWHGTAEKTLSLSTDPDKNARNLAKAVAKLLKNYPTGAPKK